MNYEKKYKEALEKARLVLQEKGNEPDGASILSELFPELIESEDERIRKEMIEILRKEAQDFPSSVIAEKSNIWIAWLEKQGEQKPNYCHHEVDLSDCSEEYRKAYYDGWNNCNQQHEQLKAEQKPAWSKEDKYTLECLIDYLETELDNSYLDEDKEIFTKEIKLLKSLRPRKQCCNDIPSREYILNVWELGNYWKELTNGVCSTEYGTELEYIQKHWKEGGYYDKISACPQKQWKPSEEQMDALLWCVAHLGGADHRVLGELYEHLKKLREE